MKVITIGRSSECSVVINDVKVSRVHAQLVQDDEGRISVVDLGSTNGTKVNGKRIAGEMRLSPGDELRVGDTVLPWQNYMATIPSQGFQPVMANAQSSKTVFGEDKASMHVEQSRNNNPKNSFLWIILAVVLGMIVAGGVVWLLLSRNTAHSDTHDTIRITDTIRDTDYEQYLFNLVGTMDSALNQQKSQTPVKSKKEESIDTLALIKDKINNASYQKIAKLYNTLGREDHLLTPVSNSTQEKDEMEAESRKKDIIQLYEKRPAAIQQIILKRVEEILGKIK